VAIVPPACLTTLPFAVDAFLGILTTELRTDGVGRVLVAPQGGKPSLAVIVLHVEPCDATAREVIVTIEDHATAKKVERRVSLGDMAESARPRALALAVAELLRASWLELAMADAPPPTAPVPDEVRVAVARRAAAVAPSSPESARAPSPAPRTLDLSLAVAWRDFPSANASMFGGRAAAGFRVLAPALWLRVDLAGLFGTAQDALGNVDLAMATAGAALLWTSPREAPVSVAVGPHLELGAAWASGSPLDQATSSFVGAGFVSLASLLGSFTFRIADSWRLAVELEGGVTLVPFEARADSRRVTGTDGAMFGVAIGVAQLR
jgi:hypothetical protein